MFVFNKITQNTSCFTYSKSSFQDILMMPHGDLTLVGERGLSLSGGQKARLNLARYVLFYVYVCEHSNAIILFVQVF